MSPWVPMGDQFPWGEEGGGEWRGGTVSQAHSLQSSVSTLGHQVQAPSFGWRSPYKAKPKPV